MRLRAGLLMGSTFLSDHFRLGTAHSPAATALAETLPPRHERNRRGERPTGVPRGTPTWPIPVPGNA